jgi:hypothetical protein
MGQLTGKPGPDPYQIDVEKMEALGRINCTHEEIASVLGMCVRTFRERLSENEELRSRLERAKHDGRSSLRRAQWKSALAGDRTMLVWLGKNELGQTDRQDVTQTGRQEIIVRYDDEAAGGATPEATP